MEITGVAGAAGFIGSNFVHFLIKEGKKVIAIDNLSYSGFLFNLEPYVSESPLIMLKEGKEFAKVNQSIENKKPIYRKLFLNQIFLQIPQYKIEKYEIELIETKEVFEEKLEKFLNGNSRFLFILGSITDEELLKLILPKTDYFVNFAAHTHVDRSILNQEEFVFTDILGTYAILKVLKTKKNVKKFIHISTDEVYGASFEGSFDEKSPLNPSSPYAASKASADLLCLAFYKTFNIPVIIVRPSNNYGPRQYPEKLIPLSIIKILKGEKVPIYGNGKQKREWIYVDDCIRAIYKVMEKGVPGEIYNIGSGFEIENIEVVKKISNILGKGENVFEFVKDRPSHDIRYFLDSSKIKALGWKPEIDFEKGLELTVKWYLENKDFYLNIMNSEEFLSFYSSWYQKG